MFDEEGDIKIKAEASNIKEIEEYFTQIKPDFLLLDNRMLELNIHELFNSITKISSGTKLIVMGNQNEDELKSSNVIYITKETSYSELIQIVKGQSFDKNH